MADQRSRLSLQMLNRENLIAVLTKMDFSDFINCRKTTRCLNQFIERNLIHMKLKFPIDCAYFHGTDLKYGRWGERNLPMNFSDLAILAPKTLQFFDVLQESINPIFEKVRKLEWNKAKISISWPQEETLLTILTELDKGPVPESLEIQGNIFFSDSITKHPLFYKVKHIDVFPFSSPDMSFLLVDHEEVRIYTGDIADFPTIIRAFQHMSNGITSTRSISIVNKQGRNFAKDSTRLVAALSGNLIWSYETHHNSRFECYDLKSFSVYCSDCRFYSVTAVGSKIGGLLVQTKLGQLVYKIFDNEQQFFKEFPMAQAIETFFE